MRYGKIRKYDIANGSGIRVTVFVVGCTLNCFGCFNKEYQSFSAGELWTAKEENLVLKYLGLPQVSGLSILGGEPLEQGTDLINLLKRVKEETNKDIWLWTGYVYEELSIKQREIIEYVDVLVDGRFILSERDLRLKFRGSKNQRIVDLNETRKVGKIKIKLDI